jgi:hypothetical protein
MWYNRLVIPLLCSPLHFFMSGSMLVLRITGRKTGRQIDLPVNYLVDEENSRQLLVISTRERTWWRNLRGGASIEACLHGRWRPGRAEVFEEPEQVVGGLRSMFHRRPGSARYFDVRGEGQGDWNADDLVRASNSRVIVQIELD